MNQFCDSLQKFMPPVKYFGAINSLTQTLAQADLPGSARHLPGTGTLGLQPGRSRQPPAGRLQAAPGLVELWATAGKSGDGWTSVSSLLRIYHDGRIKLWLTGKRLNLRREHRALFSPGKYIPLPANGSKEENVIAFARVRGQKPSSWLPHASLHADAGKRNRLGLGLDDAELVLPPESASELGCATCLRGRVCGESEPRCYAAICSHTFPSLLFGALWLTAVLRSTRITIGHFDQAASLAASSERQRAALQSAMTSCPASCWEHSCEHRCPRPSTSCTGITPDSPPKSAQLARTPRQSVFADSQVGTAPVLFFFRRIRTSTSPR